MYRFFLALALLFHTIHAEEESLPKITVSNYDSFTGKIVKGKVRMRGSPSLDSPIIREMTKGELLIVVGEADDFFAVQPPPDIKGFIFRTFVLDNKVEGNRVNVRLAPNTEAPIIAQMNSGDTAEGTISSLNNKWLEVTPPSSTRFYVAKEFIEKVGDEHFMAKVAKRKDEVTRLLQSNYAISQQEFQKTFPEIKIDRLIANYEKITKEYTDFPEQASRAKELLEELRENYLHKKIAYLEALATNRQITSTNTLLTTAPEVKTPDSAFRIQLWAPIELSHYEAWRTSHDGSIEDFYTKELENAEYLTGVVSSYSRSIKNKPGDYILINRATNLPIAFIYSTKVNLNDHVGKEITVEAIERPNNHFAYRAFFVNSIQ